MTDKSPLTRPDREAQVSALAQRQLAQLQDPAKWLTERIIVRAWAGEFGAVSIPGVQYGWRTTDEGIVEAYIRGADHIRMADLAHLAGDAFPKSTRRRRGRELEAVVTVLAAHYLSTDGGGSRSLESAYALLGQDYHLSQHRRYLRELRATYGPLTVEAA